MSKESYQAFLDDPDQDARRVELTSFFGPNAAAFLSTYERLHESRQAKLEGRKPELTGLRSAGFSLPAFLTGIVWFLYRKMWLYSAMIGAAMILIGLLPIHGNFGIGFAAALGVIGKQTYVQHAIAMIEKLRQADGSIDLDEVGRLGGVSKPAGWIAGIIFGLVTLISMLAMVKAL